MPGALRLESFRFDNAAFSAFLNDPKGPMMRKMATVGELTKVRTVATLKDGFPRKFLAPRIVKRLETTPEGPRVLVGAYSYRTEPHPIVGNPLLVFFWPKVGRVVYLPHVNHPGSNFAKYLAERLVAALALIRGGI